MTRSDNKGLRQRPKAPGGQTTTTAAETVTPGVGEGGFDRVDPKLRGKYAHIPLTEDEMEEYGPYPFLFTRMRPYALWEWALVPLVFVLTWPLKLIAVFSSFPFIIVSTFLFTWGHSIDDPSIGWKKRAQNMCVKIGARLFLFSCGYWWVTTSGQQDLDNDGSPPIVVANHVSWIDPIVHMYGHACPAFVARDVTRGIPIIGPLTESAGSLFVSREEASYKGTNSMVLNKMKRFCNSWPLHMRPLVIFPEGSATNQKCLLEFKTGAFEAGAPVQPVCVRYCQDGPFVAMEHGHPVWIVFTLLLTLRHTLHITYLPTYRPNAEEKANPALYAQNVRAVMAKELNVPMVDGIAVRERYIWFDHFYYRTTTREQYLAARDAIRTKRNGDKPVSITWPDGRTEVLK